MPTTTDLRDALREAAHTITEYASGPRVMADVARYRAIADAPPTVAELLPLVDATHEVYWQAHGEDRRIYAPDGGALAVEYRTGRMRWTEARLTVFDLRRSGRLVEVTP